MRLGLLCCCLMRCRLLLHHCLLRELVHFRRCVFVLQRGIISACCIVVSCSCVASGDVCCLLHGWLLLRHCSLQELVCGGALIGDCAFLCQFLLRCASWITSWLLVARLAVPALFLVKRACALGCSVGCCCVIAHYKSSCVAVL